MKHCGTRTLETPRLILRRFAFDDLKQMYYNCFCDHEVWKWTNYQPMHSIEDVMNKADMFTDNWLNAYERADRYSWAIQLKATDEVVGRLFGMHPDDRLCQVELAYELARKCWNQGLMSEAVQAVVDFFFKEVGFNRIYAYHAKENPASGRVLQKCGMTYEGTMRQACLSNNGIFDKVNYAILACDYFGQTPPSHANTDAD